MSTAIRRFKGDFAHRYEPIEVSASVVLVAMDMAERHGLRGYDAVQLAAAVELQAIRQHAGLPSVTFLSADSRLNIAAKLERLLVENPTDHP